LINTVLQYPEEEFWRDFSVEPADFRAYVRKAQDSYRTLAFIRLWKGNGREPYKSTKILSSTGASLKRISPGGPGLFLRGESEIIDEYVGSYLALAEIRPCPDHLPGDRGFISTFYGDGLPAGRLHRGFDITPALKMPGWHLLRDSPAEPHS
jgi:hypothetical protein